MNQVNRVIYLKTLNELQKADGIVYKELSKEGRLKTVNLCLMILRAIAKFFTACCSNYYSNLASKERLLTKFITHLKTENVKIGAIPTEQLKNLSVDQQITYLIQTLTSPPPPASLPAEIKKIDNLPIITEGFQWIEILSKDKEQEAASATVEKVKKTTTQHTRIVFISRKIPENYRKQFSFGIVVKISTREERHKKRCYWPHQEEIAYKIDKMFGWNIVPKTKVLHGSYFKTRAVNDKYFKFRAIIKSLPPVPGFFEEPTFTIQSYRKGVTLDAIKETTATVSKDSFQKAYLLNMIFCKADNNPGNTNYDPDTGQFTMFDNEFMGHSYESQDFDLDKFHLESEKEISETILSQVSSINIKSLVQIKKKYALKDEELIKLWQREWGGEKVRNESEGSWNQLLIHFYCLKSAIVQLKNTNRKITPHTVKLEQLEQRKIFQKEIPSEGIYAPDRDLKIFEFIMKKADLLPST